MPTKLTPLTTRPPSTSRQGMMRRIPGGVAVGRGGWFMARLRRRGARGGKRPAVPGWGRKGGVEGGTVRGGGGGGRGAQGRAEASARRGGGARQRGRLE